jgi:hypothetical protein
MVIKYGNQDDEKYGEDLKYWSNGCGELHMHGKYDITEAELPAELLAVYKEWWQEDKDGQYCYLAEYKGRYGIALVNEYYENYDGMPCVHNYEEACMAAEALDREFSESGIIVIVAKEQGWPAEDENATEFVVFVPAVTGKDLFDRVSLRASQLAYSFFE